MNLREYLKKEDVTIKRFAEALEVSTSTVAYYLSGHRIPKIDIVQRIEMVTEGEVTMNDLIEYHRKMKSLKKEKEPWQSHRST